MGLLLKYSFWVLFFLNPFSLIAQNGTTNISDPAVSLPSGFYDYVGANTLPHNTWWHLLNSRHINTNNDYSFQFIADFFNDDNLFFRLNKHAINNTRGTLHRIWHSGNFNLSNNSYGVDLKGVSSAGIWHSADRSTGIYFGPDFSRIRVNNNEAVFYVNTLGVGIGTTTPTEKLSVNGNIRAKKLIVSQQNWSDYVFYKNYKLRPLNELEDFIKQYQHLPEVPSAKEVASKGISVGDTQALLLKKIEELTLYVIKQDKKINEMSKKITFLEKKVTKN